ncbi:unnamed protein product [Linum tenue]|uniref:Uncharacterized protein n=1 Tax=Linum tenue TaxID=586396 RepID=A0AAV0LVC5_9ROSI|nr:unnamed protein product [Linum tenue]
MKCLQITKGGLANSDILCVGSRGIVFSLKGERLKRKRRTIMMSVRDQAANQRKPEGIFYREEFGFFMKRKYCRQFGGEISQTWTEWKNRGTRKEKQRR